MTDPRDNMPGEAMSDQDARLADLATGDASVEGGGSPSRAVSGYDEAAAALHRALAGGERMPRGLADRLAAEGEAIVGARSGGGGGGWKFPWRAGLLIAATIAIAAVGVGSWMVMERTRQLEAERARVAELRERVESNDALLAQAQTRVDELSARVSSQGEALDEKDRQLAAVEERRVRLAERLASATSTLDAALLKLTRYETPEDPEVLAENRRKLLQTPGTIRLAWAPFDLPDAPAEQQDVRGDVVWNDELETGYLRFVGLKVNDPSEEQYQVWVIDERGMEQKVSGGVFNATADGEVIVPVDPGIDVRNVALFAVTVENPGGTWVPDLRRRVVVAPRGDGGAEE